MTVSDEDRLEVEKILREFARYNGVPFSEYEINRAIGCLEGLGGIDFRKCSSDRMDPGALKH